MSLSEANIACDPIYCLKCSVQVLEQPLVFLIKPCPCTGMFLNSVIVQPTPYYYHYYFFNQLLS